MDVRAHQLQAWLNKSPHWLEEPLNRLLLALSGASVGVALAVLGAFLTL